MKVLTIDLGRSATHLHPLDENIAREYIGGRGVTSRMLFDMAEPGRDALDGASPISSARAP